MKGNFYPQPKKKNQQTHEGYVEGYNQAIDDSKYIVENWRTELFEATIDVLLKQLERNKVPKLKENEK